MTPEHLLLVEVARQRKLRRKLERKLLLARRGRERWKLEALGWKWQAMHDKENR